ncbi:MAG: hypothetical protein M4579_006496 [Chaenotheca gracillima]|nr:MAG: hypothetical protein M4579_006496 [Chaenotheca gracillima]
MPSPNEPFMSVQPPRPPPEEGFYSQARSNLSTEDIKKGLRLTEEEYEFIRTVMTAEMIDRGIFGLKFNKHDARAELARACESVKRQIKFILKERKETPEHFIMKALGLIAQRDSQNKRRSKMPGSVLQNQNRVEGRGQAARELRARASARARTRVAIAPTSPGQSQGAETLSFKPRSAEETAQALRDMTFFVWRFGQGSCETLLKPEDTLRHPLSEQASDVLLTVDQLDFDVFHDVLREDIGFDNDLDSMKAEINEELVIIRNARTWKTLITNKIRAGREQRVVIGIKRLWALDGSEDESEETDDPLEETEGAMEGTVRPLEETEDALVGVGDPLEETENAMEGAGEALEVTGGVMEGTEAGFEGIWNVLEEAGTDFSLMLDDTPLECLEADGVVT